MAADHVILTGLFEGRTLRFELGDGAHVVGRGEDCAVRLPESSVSRHHAEVEVAGGRVRVRDLGSSNGTRVNGLMVAGWRELQAGDRVTTGRVTLTVGGDPVRMAPLLTIVGQSDAHGVAVDWREISATTLGDGKRSALFGVLAQAGDLLTRPRAPEALYEPILDLVETVAEPSRALVVLIGAGGEPEIHASRLKGDAPSRDVVLSSAIVDRILGERASFLIRDAMEDDGLRSRDSIVISAMRTAMAAPLFDNERVIGLLYADSTRPGRPYTTDELHAFTMLANIVAVALTHARYRAVEREKQRLDTELDAARRIMHAMQRQELPAIPGYRLATHVEPCSEVGGDLHDAIALDDGRVALVVGDVAGKGLGAALLVASLLPLLRGMCGRLDDLPAVLAHLNAEMWRITEPFRFATVFVGVLEPAAGRLVYANAGHNPPLVVRAGGGLEELATTGPPVAAVECAGWTAAETRLDSGDLLVLYSDGITEAWDRRERDYGVARLRDVLAVRDDRGAVAVRDAVLADLREFLGEARADDDITLMVLARED